MKRIVWVFACGVLFVGCGPEQIGVAPEAFKAVDALYTAVSLRDLKLVEQCAASLRELEAKSKLPASAGESLASIIEEGRSGRWESAQAHLGDFMRGQRR